MALTPETIARHELIGLPVRVAECTDSSRVGLVGRVAAETTQTVSIDVCVEDAPDDEEAVLNDETAVTTRVNAGDDDRVRTVLVPKSETVFEFAITDDTADPVKGSGIASTQIDLSPSTAAQLFAWRDGDDRDGEDVTYVTVDGSRLLSRPARRSETTGDSPWQ